MRYILGLPPGIMWPSRSQLKFTVEDEKTYFATLQEMIQVVKDQEAQEKLEDQKRWVSGQNRMLKGRVCEQQDYEMSDGRVLLVYMKL